MSNSDWWGNWRPNLPAHTGDLQPTDLIECTSIIGGQPVNTAITGQQIINAASGGGATWGGITGTLSNQTDLQSALNAKEPSITAGTTAQYYRGDKTFQTLNKSAVGLGNVDNTSDANKPISTATQTALNAKQDTLVSGSNIKTVNGSSILGSGDVTISSNPRLLGFSGINGTNSSGTAVTICHSLMIPANTLTTNSILQLVFRMNRVSGNTGQMFGRIYFNTTNSLTGASLFNTIFTMNGGSTQFLGYVERNFSYDGTNLTSYNNTAYSEYTTGAALSVAFNRTVNNWVLFTMQAQSSAEIANINLFKVFAYV